MTRLGEHVCLGWVTYVENSSGERVGVANPEEDAGISTLDRGRMMQGESLTNSVAHTSPPKTGGDVAKYGREMIDGGARKSAGGFREGKKTDLNLRGCPCISHR